MFKKSIIYVAIGLSLSASSVHIPATSGIHDMRPKNHDRGGSKGKGGKIKYARR
jgi:hypothetical protein